MREILFRGKILSGWAYGFYKGDHPFVNESYIGFTDEETYSAKSETICQFIGFKDKNNTKIFEGDIVMIDNDKENIFEIIFKGIGFWFKRLNGEDSGNLLIFSPESYWLEVIGNIYDNPTIIENTDYGKEQSLNRSDSSPCI